jgi:hypothetical protein
MKIIEINSDELQINSNGVGTLIGGLLFAAVGVGLGSWGFITQLATNRWISVGIGAVFLLGGVAIFLSAASRRVTLRHTGTSEVTTTKLITKKADSITFTTEQIASINFETHTEYDRTTDRDGDTRETQRRVSSVKVLLKDTTEIMLATSQGGNSGFSINGMNLSQFSRAPLYDEATRIASFYNVPLNTNMRTQDPIAGLAQVVSTVKQGIGASSTQPPSVVAQSPQIMTSPIAPPQLAPVESPLLVQPVVQVGNPVASEVVAVPPVIPVAPVAPVVSTTTSQRVQGDNSLQVPPRN